MDGRSVVRAGGVAALLCCALAAAATRVAAQQVAASSRAPADGERISVDIDRMPLQTAIQVIARRANLSPIYNEKTIPSVLVSSHVKNVTVAEAFRDILDGVGLVAIQTTGYVSIRRAGDVSVAAGSITGTVTDAATSRRIGGAFVVLDSMHAVRTHDNGTYVLADIPAGRHRLTVRSLGYRATSLFVTVQDDHATVQNVALVAAVNTLTDVVTTATGNRQRLEVGNAVGTIKADSIVATSLIRNMSDLLQARVPGLIVQNMNGAVGSPSRIRLRGVTSMALNNDPIVILDGVRLNAQTTVAQNQMNVGSQYMLNRMGQLGNGANPTYAPSRLDDIDPTTIESIDILRGPSASSLYGTDAANGVIVIKTKRGHVGSWQTTVVGDEGRSYYPGSVPEAWWGWQHNTIYGERSDCSLATGTFNVAYGTCQQDSVTHFNPLNDPFMTTLGTGTTSSLSGSVSGGSESLQQFLSVSASNQVGMSKMSTAEQHNIARLWNEPAPSWMVHPNTQQGVDGSSRTTFNISPKMDVSLTTNAIYRNVLGGGTSLPMNMINVGTGSSPSDTLGFLPSENERTKISSIAKRGLVSSTGGYRPLHWLSFSGAVGGDYTLRTDAADLRAQDCTPILSSAINISNNQNCASGHTNRRDETFLTTVNGGATMTFNPFSWLRLTTSLGEQYSHTNWYSLQAGNSDPIYCPLAFGSSLLSPGPVCVDYNMQQFNVTENRDESATAGWYVEETVNLFGLYTTLGRRQDVASAFGGQVNKSPPNYPKFNLSFPISEQSFFPKQSVVSSLRARVAYGQSGNQASQTAIYNVYTNSQTTFGTSSTAVNLITLDQLGNPDLRPERGTEWEGGFDISFLENERLHFEATMSRKLTRDAIVMIQQAFSYGVNNTTQYANVGNVENRSLELLAKLRLLDTRAYSWDLTVNLTHTSNKLVHKSPGLCSCGETDPNNYMEGYPLNGLWGVPVVSYQDLNHDGILAQNEIAFGPREFMGAPYPKAEITYANDVGLFNGALRVSALFDHVAGSSNVYYVYPLLVRAAFDRTASLASQAAWVQATEQNYTYISQSSSLRFNELSVTYTVPPRLTARLLRARNLSLTFAGRNLALWTTYAGKDPNVDTGGLSDAIRDNGSALPQPRQFTLRFNLGL